MKSKRITEKSYRIVRNRREKERNKKKSVCTKKYVMQ